MSLFCPGGNPAFEEVLRLFDLRPLLEKARLQELRTRDGQFRSRWNAAIRDARTDADAALRAQNKLEQSERAVRDQELVVALLEDQTFRRDLGALSSAWGRYRMRRTGARNDRFQEYVAEQGEDTAELRAAWEAVRGGIAGKGAAKKAGGILIG